MKIFSIIPAKGTSKGMPGKNLKLLDGHPLVAYGIAASLESRLIERTICSTDSEEIADVAKSYGAEVPFLRPAHFAQDLSPDYEVFLHAIEWLVEKEGVKPDIIVHLRPTSPIRMPGWIDEAIQLLIDNPDADSVRSVCESPANPFKMWQIMENNRLKPLIQLDRFSEAYNAPRQLLPKTWWQTGMVDIIRTSVIEKKHSMTGDYILPYRIPKEQVVDVDERRDLILAELVMKELDCIRPKKI